MKKFLPRFTLWNNKNPSALEVAVTGIIVVPLFSVVFGSFLALCVSYPFYVFPMIFFGAIAIALKKGYIKFGEDTVNDPVPVFVKDEVWVGVHPDDLKKD